MKRTLIALMMTCWTLASAAGTGNPAIAPPWSMEPWIWEDDVNTSKAAWELLNGYRKHDLPVGAVMLDSPWSTAYNNFVFDEARYLDPRGMIDAWHKMGVPSLQKAGSAPGGVPGALLGWCEMWRRTLELQRQSELP